MLQEAIRIQAVRVLGVTIIAFISALMLTPALFKFLKKFGIKKQIRSAESAPIFAKLHAKKEGTPTMGGVLIWLSVLGLAIIFGILNHFFDGFFGYLNFINRAETYLPLAAMFIAAGLGFLDDLLGVLRIGPKGGGMTVRQKFIMYCVIAAIGAWWFYAKLGCLDNVANACILRVPFFGNFDVGLWYIPIFMLVVVASAFSADLTDGLDGLLGGVSLFIFGGLMIVSFLLRKYNLAVMIGAVIGSLLAFLWNNINPAKFFMGDTGSMALGITMGVIAMQTDSALLLPIIALPLVLETLSVIIQTISKKLFHRKIFLSTPIHHHFEAIGMPEAQITMRFWIIGFISAGFGVILFVFYLFGLI
ncbi:MAG: phospho-N-acetylmuramoyl-pentapeptide-transferase [Patescibacteria group bacterium]|nr:phospho-N-acetylmuramoyl-pentapeptide-transferase [Patescibacteria group bacterium]MCL5261774.1 phospho-N-acetylmuramoyl-pentapeptide-transferase [Patescibacteria group bacterium]